MVLGLEIKTEEVENIIVLRLNGRIDASSSSQLHDKLARLDEEKRNVILLDFTNIDYLSSAGLRELLFFSKLLRFMIIFFLAINRRKG